MTAFMICGAIIAAILFLANFWLSQLEKKDMNGGLIEDHKRYTIWGVIKGSIREQWERIKKKHGKQKEQDIS